MESYARLKLVQIFQEYMPREEGDSTYTTRANNIVNALLRKYRYEDDFKNAFWKILYNLRLKSTSSETLKELFEGKWKSADEFVNATDDDLDSRMGEYRRCIRGRCFQRLKDMKLFNDNLDSDASKEMNDSNHKEDSGGLQCPKCRSCNTEYLLLQTSRGDEGATARSVCLQCGHRWKFR